MLTWGLILLIGGIVLAFGSFIFAVVNMGFGAAKTMKGKRSSFGSMFVGHLGAMIGMACGGMMSAIGIVLLLVHYVPIIMDLFK